MGFAERRRILSAIEMARGSKVITLITSDRYATVPFPGIQGVIAADQASKIAEHVVLTTGNRACRKLDLFLYSRGGDTNSAWPIVNNIRAYCSEFDVLVPIHAHSAATLIALGANAIVMSKIGNLSPIDPTVANAFNPKDEATKQPLGISVEDVTSFISLAKDKNKANIKSEENVTKVFEALVRKVHPLALGNVQRSHTQIRQLARKLLGLHVDLGKDDRKIGAIIDGLTERFYTHNHSIFRKEAAEMFKPVSMITEASEIEERLLGELYIDYENEMQLKDYFDPNVFLGKDDEKILETAPVMIESQSMSSKFLYRQLVRRAMVPDPNFRMQVVFQRAQAEANRANLHAQLSQLNSNVLQLWNSFAQAKLQQPENTVYAQLNNSFSSLDTEIRNAIAKLSKAIDLTELRNQVEMQVERIAWIDSK